VIASLQTDDLGYVILLVIHLVLVVFAFGVAFAIPFYTRHVGGEAAVVADRLLRTHVLPAMLLAGLVGIVMVLLGQPWEFSDGWISVAFVLWFAALGNALFLLGPASRRLASAVQGDANIAALRSRVAMFTGIGHLLFVALVIVMVWGPRNP
jgi:uncharacterized membrane protein